MQEAILLEYIWLDGNKAKQIRSKVKVVDVKSLAEFDKTGDVKDLPTWSFDGSSTNQAEGKDSDCYLKPVKYIFHPTYSNGFSVLCEVLDSSGKVHPSNTRRELEEADDFYKDQEALFGIEQEYTLYFKGKPLGFYGQEGEPKPQGPYYCGQGAENIFGRHIADDHMNACLSLDLKLCGINAEVMPGQWEYQIGPLPALEVADQLWLSRWLLLRVAEKYGVTVSFEPKPVIDGDWNGAGCHTNFSTSSMRQPGGMKYIEEAIQKLSKAHKEHISKYGEDNDKRLTGKHETCDINTFKHGNCDRGASIRIPLQVKADGYGYFEDRRPAANMDPYEVCYMLLKTVCAN